MTTQFLSATALVVVLSGGMAAAPISQHTHDASPGNRPAKFEIPGALKAEHDELHQELAAASKLPGRTGQAAKQVAALLHPHFVTEEEFALPPLGLLVPIASGRLSPDMREVIPLVDRLRADMPRMLDEHKRIVAALADLAAAGRAEDHPGAVEFANKLTQHAQNEEQVLYPAALVAGEYVRLKFPK